MSLEEIGPVVLVGAGKMGLALARGWIAGGLPPAQLVLVDPKPGEATVAFAKEHDIRLLDSPIGILVHVLVLAVKGKDRQAPWTLALADAFRAPEFKAVLVQKFPGYARPAFLQ